MPRWRACSHSVQWKMLLSQGSFGIIVHAIELQRLGAQKVRVQAPRLPKVWDTEGAIHLHCCQRHAAANSSSEHAETSTAQRICARTGWLQCTSACHSNSV